MKKHNFSVTGILLPISTPEFLLNLKLREVIYQIGNKIIHLKNETQ